MPGPKPHSNADDARPILDVRPETGAMRFPGDWPGIFIRGDEALDMASRAQFLKNHYGEAEIVSAFLDELIKLFEKCRVQGNALG